MEILGENRREGLGRKSGPRVTLFLFLLVSIFLLLSGLYTAEASIFRKARASVLDATAPILALFSAPINSVNNLIGGVGDYFNVVAENKSLRQENAELRQWMEEALALRDVISIYEGLQSYQTAPDVSPIDAHVIGDSNDAFAKSMVVNVGSAKKIKTGFAVVNETGLVGRIIDVGLNASRVLLLTDIQSRVPVYIEDAKFEGILTGRTSLRPVINFTNEVIETALPQGARILTSGAGGVIPRGIPVGTVGATKGDLIEVDLYADYTQTRLVRVLDYAFPILMTTQDPVSDPASIAPTDQGNEPASPNEAGTSDARASDETAAAIAPTQLRVDQVAGADQAAGADQGER